tara:strand:+ start:200 stop:688 length:489 start_codon:yes stop_codon:yes gene_type:complete
MSRVLIISATAGNNLILAKKIGELLTHESEIINLEDFIMPLYIPNIQYNKNAVTASLEKKFLKSQGLIFCAPEYNGGSPPILTNSITWLSVTTNNWRDLFINKKALIATNSGGAGFRFLSTFRVQLEHLGVIVYPRTITVNKKKEFNDESANNILKGFIELL